MNNPYQLLLKAHKGQRASMVTKEKKGKLVYMDQGDRQVRYISKTLNVDLYHGIFVLALIRVDCL